MTRTGVSERGIDGARGDDLRVMAWCVLAATLGHLILAVAANWHVLELTLARPRLIGWSDETRRETWGDIAFLAREILPAMAAVGLAAMGVRFRRHGLVWLAALVPLTFTFWTLRFAAHWFLGPAVSWLP